MMRTIGLQRYQEQILGLQLQQRAMMMLIFFVRVSLSSSIGLISYLNCACVLCGYLAIDKYAWFQVRRWVCCLLFHFPLACIFWQLMYMSWVLYCAFYLACLYIILYIYIYLSVGFDFTLCCKSMDCNLVKLHQILWLCSELRILLVHPVLCIERKSH